MRTICRCSHTAVAHGVPGEQVLPGAGCRAVFPPGTDGAPCPCPGWSPVELRGPADARDERVWALEKALDVLGALDEGPVLADVLAYAEYIRTGERP